METVFFKGTLEDCVDTFKKHLQSMKNQNKQSRLSKIFEQRCKPYRPLFDLIRQGKYEKDTSHRFKRVDDV